MSEESTSIRKAERGRVEDALARMYGRLGSRIVVVCIVGGYAYGLFTMCLVVLGGSRYLGLSVGRFLSAWPAPLAAVAFSVVGLLPSRQQIRTILMWRDDQRTVDRAGITWRAVVQWRHAITRVVLAASVAIPPAAVYIAILFHKPWYAVPAGLIGLAGVLGALWAATVFSAELVLRPMLEDVAAHLPGEFEPSPSSLRLRTKAAAALPAVTFFAALIVGAYANLLPNGTLRAMLAIGVAFATVVVATIIFLIINRSVLSPIDDLIAATERVREGDIATRVPLVSDDELGTLAVSFNQMLAELKRHTEELQASRERIVAAADEERRRVERDIHDGAQQQLVLAQMKLSMLERLIDSDPSSTKAAIAELREELARALADLRDLAHGLYPPLLESDGLPGALREAVDRAAIPATLECDGAGRYRPELEAAVYFCCLEALQNAAKHAGDGARATVTLSETNDTLRFTVADDGRGHTSTLAGTGIQNMTDRIGALGGELSITSVPGDGTSVAGKIPLETR